MHARAAEFLRGHRLVGDGLHHVGPRHEHVARVLDHEDEVRHRRRVDVAAGARSHDHADLGDDARRQGVAKEHFAVAPERRHALLDACAAGVEYADDRRAVLQRHVLYLGDLPGVRLRKRPPEHREVLGEHVDDAAVDGAPAGDDAVARNLDLLHPEVGRAVLDVHVELLEAVFVHQQLDALTRRQLAALVLRVDAGLAAAETSGGSPTLEFLDHVLHPGIFPYWPLTASNRCSAPWGQHCGVIARAALAASRTID